MIASDPLPEGAPSPVTGGSWVDGPTLLLPPTNLALLLGDMENSPAAGSWCDEDEICDNVTVLGEPFMASTSDEAPTEILGGSGATDVIGEIEVDNSSGKGSCVDEVGEWENATILDEIFVATVTDETATMQVFEDIIDETEEKDSETIPSCFDEDGEWGIATILGDSLMATTSIESAAKEVLRKSGAVDVIGETEVLVTSGTEQSKYI